MNDNQFLEPHLHGKDVQTVFEVKPYQKSLVPKFLTSGLFFLAGLFVIQYMNQNPKISAVIFVFLGGMCGVICLLFALWAVLDWKKIRKSSQKL